MQHADCSRHACLFRQTDRCSRVQQAPAALRRSFNRGRQTDARRRLSQLPLSTPETHEPDAADTDKKRINKSEQHDVARPEVESLAARRCDVIEVEIFRVGEFW